MKDESWYDTPANIGKAALAGAYSGLADYGRYPLHAGVYAAEKMGMIPKEEAVLINQDISRYANSPPGMESAADARAQYPNVYGGANAASGFLVDQVLLKGLIPKGAVSLGKDASAKLPNWYKNALTRTEAAGLSALKEGVFEPTADVLVESYNKNVPPVKKDITPLPKKPLSKRMSQQDLNLLNYHRDSLLERNGAKPLINQDGSTTTILMTGVKGADGRIYNVPGYDNKTGKILSNPYDRWEKDIAAGVFPSVPDKMPFGSKDMAQHPANVYARDFHKIVDADMAAYEQPKGPRKNMSSVPEMKVSSMNMYQDKLNKKSDDYQKKYGVTTGFGIN